MGPELVIPHAARQDERSLEMARVWIAGNALHCTLKIGFYADRGMAEEESWGTILADMAQHVADALVASGVRTDRQLALARVQQAFEEEMANPTTRATGDFAKPDN
ncbi:MAG: DUF5076 domain-containing protein [Hyphomonadaceae bacterium]|nr:DUF5076 domain-containing protein [Hyphomonadaceae bacterium]